MKINLPRKIVIDIDNIPDNFDEIIQKSFAEYTACTNPEFMYHDKLLYIDVVLRKLHNADACEDVNQKIKGCFDFTLDEYDVISDESDFLTIGFMRECYELGADKHKLYSYDFTENRQDNEKIMLLLIRIIKAVMNYER